MTDPGSISRAKQAPNWVTAIRTVWLWLATAFCAGPVTASFICLTVVTASVLGPLAMYGVKLSIDGISTAGAVTHGIVLIGISLAASAVSGQVQSILGQTLDDKVERYVRDDLLRLSNQIPSLTHYEHPAMADRIALLERDTRVLGGVYRLISLFAVVSSCTTVIVMLYAVQPWLCLLPVLAAIPVTLTVRGLVVRGRLWQYNERFRRLGSKVVDVMTEPAQGVEIRCFGLHRPLLEIARYAFDARAKPWIAETVRFSRAAGVGWVIFAAGYALCVGLMIVRARSGEATVGDLALLLLVGPQITATAAAVSINATAIINSTQTFGRYRWLRDYAEANSWSSATAEASPRLTAGITFDNVSFAYSEADPGSESDQTRRWVIRGLNLHLPAGTTVAMVGENGAGKSTVVKLLARLYDPAEGRILIDGVSLSDMDPLAWRQHISAGFQDFASLEFLATDSVGVGDLPARTDTRRVEAAVEAGQASSVIDSLPEGLGTQLGTRFAGGVGLSGGQWQRLAIARAFMRTTPLLVLLDEPTAALDPEAEQAIYEQYYKAAKAAGKASGAVTILVSHRFSTVRMADLIVVLEAGRVVESGSHAELIEAAGRYARLFNIQARAYL
jgi:ATP-binding cassette subfamily B protein